MRVEFINWIDKRLRSNARLKELLDSKQEESLDKIHAVRAPLETDTPFLSYTSSVFPLEPKSQLIGVNEKSMLLKITYVDVDYLNICEITDCLLEDLERVSFVDFIKGEEYYFDEEIGGYVMELEFKIIK